MIIRLELFIVLAIIIFASLFVLHIPAPIWCSTVDSSNIDIINKKIHEHRIEIDKTTEEELQIIEKLDIIEKQYIKESNDLDNLTAKIDSLQKLINESKSAIDTINADKIKKEAYLKVRLNAIYKYYRQGLFKIILSSPSYSTFIRQEKLIKDVLSTDYALLQDCQIILDKYNAHQNDLTLKKELLITAKNNLAEKQEIIKVSRAEKVSLLDKIKHEKSLQLNALNELEKLSHDLQTFVEQLPQKKDDAGVSPYKFSMLKGKLRFPVKGTIISNFGKKEYPDLHTSTFQKGIEIECPFGTEIKAIFDGKVVFADWFKGYGFMMIIDHGEGYFSLLAHASKLLKRINDLVHEGETVALVGDTNSINGSCLYFEIRHHGNPQNPLNWLKHDFS